MTVPGNDGLPQEVLDLLAQPLDRALVRERARDDGNVFAYIDRQVVIDQANRIFGYGRWGAETLGEPRFQAVDVVFPESGEVQALGMYTVTVRVTVMGCPQKSDVGSGFVFARTLEEHSNAAKAAVTDGMKRAFSQFGTQFGHDLNERRYGSLASPAKLDELRKRLLALLGRLGVAEPRAREWFRERHKQDLEAAGEQELTSTIRVLANELNEREAGRRKAA